MQEGSLSEMEGRVEGSRGGGGGLWAKGGMEGTHSFIFFKVIVGTRHL